MLGESNIPAGKIVYHKRKPSLSTKIASIRDEAAALAANIPHQQLCDLVESQKRCAELEKALRKAYSKNTDKLAVFHEASAAVERLVDAIRRRGDNEGPVGFNSGRCPDYKCSFVLPDDSQ